MNIEFDPNKNQINYDTHGYYLEYAQELEWHEALIWLDTRFDYGEPREVAILPKGDRLFYVAFVDKETHYRIISLRLATAREVTYYVSNY